MQGHNVSSVHLELVKHVTHLKNAWRGVKAIFISIIH